LQKLEQVGWNGITRFDETPRADHCVKGARIPVLCTRAENDCQ